MKQLERVGGRERLRWAQCGPERGADSPEALGANTHTHSLADRHISLLLIV